MPTAPLNPSFVLSREEVLLILSLLKSDYIFGLDPDPVGQLSAEQAALGMLHSERSLRARDLARINDDGQLIIQEALLKSVGICAYAQWSVLAHHFADTGETLRYFGHQRGPEFVAHTVLQEGTLHQFSFMADKAKLLEQVLATCQCENLPSATGPQAKLPTEALKQARTTAAQGNLAAVTEGLAKAGLEPALAQRLSTMLVEPHRVSIIHTLTHLPENQLAKRELTILHNDQEAWLLVQSAEETAQNMHTLKPVTTPELKNLLENL